MLQIRLSKNPSAEGGGGTKPMPADSVTVACPDHLVLADLPVAKGLGSATAASVVKIVGRRSRRQLGDRVHFCVRCDFPIAIYGRLSPCEHAFCLDCARSDSMCYLCDERIHKIQTIKMMEGIFICAAPHCLKSFIKQPDFESHIYQTHVDLLHPSTEKEGNESETANYKKLTASDSVVQATPRQVFSPAPNFQPQDSEDKYHRPQRDQTAPWPLHMQPKQMQPFSGTENHPSDSQHDNRPPGFERLGPHNPFPQGSEAEGGLQLESSQLPEKQLGVLPEIPYPEYPVHAHQPTNFIMPMNPNQVLAPPSFNYPSFVPDGAQPFMGTHYALSRSDSVAEVGPGQGSLHGAMNFAENYPRPWINITDRVPFESFGPGQDRQGFSGMPDSQGRAALFQADYGRSPTVFRSNVPLPQAVNKGIDPMQGVNAMDPKDGKGVLAAQPLQLPLPPMPAPHMSQLKRGMIYTGEVGHEGQSYGWPEKNDSFGSGQD